MQDTPVNEIATKKIQGDGKLTITTGKKLRF